MTDPKRPMPGFVVLHQTGEGQWQLVGEAERRPGLTARAARTQAIQALTGGRAKAGDVYAVIPRSEWRVALDN